MLSICIPVYNYDIRALVGALHRQALMVDVPVEILLVDDASDGPWQEVNRGQAALPLVQLHELAHNVGRSRIRNILCSKARYGWLLFMDCDSMPPDELFLQRYLQAARQEAVICGGRAYLPAPPSDPTHLHWWYGSNREVQPARRRNSRPYHSFMTNNFMVPRSILSRIPFNEQINGYGHEDTLFGYELMQQGIAVRHIDNPLLHTGLQSQEEFLEKIRQGISNLWRIHEFMGQPVEFARMVRLLRAYHRLERLKLTRLFCHLTRPLQGVIHKKLAGEKPALYYLDLYKLRLLCMEAGG